MKPDADNRIAWAVASRPFPGQSVCGDLHVVAFFPEHILLAVMDGLGHGEEAAAAARTAADCLRHTPVAAPAELFRECHEALRGSRGIVLTLAIYFPGSGTLQWAGVGNVEGVLWQRPGRNDEQRQCIVPRGGVVGYQLPKLHVSTLSVAVGDVCCLATDGIASAFAEGRLAESDPQRLAGRILAQYGKATDDALVLTVRFGGESADERG